MITCLNEILAKEKPEVVQAAKKKALEIIECIELIKNSDKGQKQSDPTEGKNAD